MNEKHHMKLVEELISSEESYLKQLEKIEVFFSNALKGKEYIPSDVHSAIFSHILSIQRMNQILHDEMLKNKANIWQAFLKLGQFLKAYSSYANKFQSALALLQEWQTRSEPFRAFIRATETRPEVQSGLMALLITPIQRIPRYRLLLEELLKCTDPSYSCYSDLTAALLLVSEVAEHINRSVDNASALQRLMILQKAFRNQRPNIIAPGRTLLKEGILNKVSRKGRGSHPRMFFLFSDMIVYSKILTLHLHSASTAEYCKVKMIFGSQEHPVTFRLQCFDEDLLLYSRNSTEGRDWMEAIKSAVSEAVEKRKTLRKSSSKKTTIRGPALQKFNGSSDDSDSEASPRESIPDPATGLRSPSFSFTPETLTSRIQQAKECLHPAASWLTTQVFRKNPSQDGRKSVAESEAVASPSPASMAHTLDCASPRNYFIISKSSPHGISPLALCSSGGVSSTTARVVLRNEELPDGFVANHGYDLRSSVILRNKAKANLLFTTDGVFDNRKENLTPNITVESTGNQNVHCHNLRRKRPLSDFILSDLFNAKKARKV